MIIPYGRCRRQSMSNEVTIFAQWSNYFSTTDGTDLQLLSDLNSIPNYLLLWSFRLSFAFSFLQSFLGKQQFNLTTNKCEELTSKRCRDSNSQPLNRQSPSITTSPVPNPIKKISRVNSCCTLFKRSDWLKNLE